MPADIDVVLIDLDERVAKGASDLLGDLRRVEAVSGSIGSVEDRVRALQDQLDTPYEPADRSGRATIRHQAEAPKADIDWDVLVAEARHRLSAQGCDSRTVDDILGPEAVRDIERRFSAEFRIKTRLDRYDLVAMASAGLVAGLVDFFFVRIPADMPYPLRSGLMQEGSPLTKWLHNQSVPHSDGPLSAWAKVAYDRVNLTSSGQLIPGSGGKTHRFHTLGHDPLLGLVFGVLDILRGSTTAIDRAGGLVYIPGTAPPVGNPLLALALQLAHVLSDAGTAMGVPAPGWTSFGAARFGSIGPDDLTLAEVSRLMYLKGYDLRHFATQTLSVAAAELVLHLYWYVREALDAEWGASVEREWALRDLTQSLDDHDPIRRLGSHPRYEALALGTHAVGAAANAGKIALMEGNPLALNYEQWMRFFHASYRYSKRFFGPPSKTLINSVWLNERALACDWPELDWSAPSAPRLGH